MTPLAWTNQEMVLYHGTTSSMGRDIVDGGVSLSFSRRLTDFGLGFYATTNLRQARLLATERAEVRRATAAVVELRLPRESLAALDSLAFVLGGPGADDFWSLIQFCRSGAAGHGRDHHVTSDSYDVIFGPVTKNVGQRTIYQDYDQVSFHTDRALQLLNRIGGRRMIEPWT
jgi:hypothetical protein